MNIETNPQIAFLLGAISTIVLSVIANIITNSITDWFRNWYAGFSKNRAVARIKTLQEELSTISECVASPEKTSTPFREAILFILRDLGFAGFVITMSFFDKNVFTNYLLLLVGLWMFMRINQRATRWANIFKKINNFDVYKKETEELIRKFEKVSQTDKGSDKTKTG